MKTTIFGLTMLFAISLPISKLLMTYSGLGGMYSEFWKQFGPTAFITSNLLLNYGISLILAILLVSKLKFKERLPSPIAGKYFIWIGGTLILLPSVLRIFTSMVPGGGASFALMSIASPFVLMAKFLLYIGIFQLLLAIKPNEKYSYTG